MDELSAALKRLAANMLLFLRQTDRKLLVVIGCGVLAAVLFGTLFGKIFRPDYPDSEWQYLPRYVEDEDSSSLQQQEGSLTVEEKSLDVVPGKLSGDSTAEEKTKPRAASPGWARRKTSGALPVLKGVLGGPQAQYDLIEGDVTSDSRETIVDDYQKEYGAEWERAIKKDIIFDRQTMTPELFNLNWGEFGDVIGELESMPEEEKEELLREKMHER